MSLFTSLAITVGDSRQASGFLDFLRADGTLNGKIPPDDFSGAFRAGVFAPSGSNYKVIIPTEGGILRQLLRYSSIGVFESVLFEGDTNGTINAMAVKGSILYYLSEGSSTFFTFDWPFDGGVHRFNIAAGTPLSDFISPATDNYAFIAVSPTTGDVFLTVMHSPFVGPGHVERWSATGVLQQTYTRTNWSTLALFAIAVDADGLHFWVGTQDDEGNEIVEQILISDGSLTTFIPEPNIATGQLLITPGSTLGNLFVIDKVNSTQYGLKQFDADGTLISEDNPLDHGDFNGPRAVAIISSESPCVIRTSDLGTIFTLDGSRLATNDNCTEAGGIYFINKNKLDDTYILDGESTTVKIPDPFAVTGFIGDE